ncbi:methyl-accepting chemotaxis protein [Glaciecola sp. KUL10]|uniref:methyl-accepting chemotaxis protein n=1 Tax=Glaciecola sp. (strain KUL10) TaxID=2161813 RepID=UPI0013143BDC|nr:methyl-accepting chemotaxis protein [Glaciecola sp. KUL10]
MYLRSAEKNAVSSSKFLLASIKKQTKDLVLKVDSTKYQTDALTYTKPPKVAYVFQFKSISTQITVATGISLLGAILAMGIYGVVASTVLYDTTSKSIINHNEHMVAEALKQVSSKVERINQDISNNIIIAKNIASTQSFIIQNDLVETIDRDTFSQYLKHILSDNQQISGTYIAWEPNAVDNNDAKYINDGRHSDSSGQYAPYWTRASSGELNVRPSNMPLVYNNRKPNEHGLRPGEWYLCPFESRKSCVSDPSVWEVQGVPTLMTSITTPLIVNEQVIGVSGVDVSVAFIQQLASTVNDAIFEGVGTLKIISFNGAIVADTSHPEQAGLFMDKNEWASIKSNVQSGISRIKMASDNIEVLLPLNFANTDTKWSVKLLLPTSVAMQDASNLNLLINESFTTNVLGQLFAGILVGLAGFLVVYFVAGKLSRPIKKAAYLVSELSKSDGDLTQRIDLEYGAEIGVMADGLNSFLHKTHQTIKDTSDSVNKMTESAEKSSQLSEKTNKSVNSQKNELSQATTAILQLSQTAQQVAQKSEQTAKSVDSAYQKVKICAHELDDTVDSLQELTDKMRNTAHDMNQLESSTQSISGILAVIKEISEQTNLLALNAAIEAARAGEQGRGFAVVANEVRNLANRTQESTEEINKLMHSLTVSAEVAVKTMREGTDTCEHNMQRANISQTQLQEIVRETQDISNASVAIAEAIEQQTLVSTEITNNINNLNLAVDKVSSYASKGKQQNEELEQRADDIRLKLHQFKF